MQLELEAVGAPRARATPRVLAVVLPDLPLQRALSGRDGAGGSGRARAPVAIERAGRILCCDADARGRGVVPGDGLVQARAMCADLVVLAEDEAADRALLEGLAEALLAIAPIVEVAPPDALLLDASAARLLGGGAAADGEAALARRAIELTRDLGLHGRVAIADGRAPARALARVASGEAAAGVEDTAAALARLPVAALGIDRAVADRLAALGLREARQLAGVPVETLAHRFGPVGVAAWRIATGDDPSPLVPYAPVRLPEESLELEGAVESLEPLLFALKRLCDRAAMRLAGRRLGATRLAVTLRLDGAGDERLDIGLAAPSAAASRWVLVLRERLGSLRLQAPVVAVTLSVAEAANAPGEQLAIGDRPEQLVALETVLARLTARLGEAALFTAVPADRHRPEAAYETARFVSGRDGSPSRRDDLERPMRLLPRPEPLVALGEGGRLAAVRLGGRTLRVLALSPAERLAGEWWDDPFDRDYHRVRLEALGDCWMFRDGRDGRLWLHGFFD